MLELRGLQRLGVGPIDLELRRGRCACIRGRSGAGKSVLLRMVADLDPHEGEALLDGQARSGMPAPQWRRRVCYVAAESVWWEPTVGAHFAETAVLARCLPQVGIRPEAASWPVERLSSGERQRLALLRGLVTQPQVLLLDEPSSALDGESVAQVEALLQAELQRGLAILLVTHDAAQAGRLATEHWELRDGRLSRSAA